MKTRIAQNPLPALFFTIFVDLIGFGILIPIIPQLFANPSSAFFLLPASYDPRQGYVLLGLLIGIFPFGQFLATPILGQMSDKYGRKKILALCLVGTSLAYILFAVGVLTKNLPLLFIARFFDGMTGGNISVAQAAIADITPPEKRARNFGLVGAAFGTGFILGPYIGGKLSDSSVLSWFNAATPFWFAAMLSFFNVLSVLFFMPETHEAPDRGIRMEWNRSMANIRYAFQIKNLRMLFSVVFLFQSGLAFYITFFGVFLIRRFSFTQGSIGEYFAYIGLLIAFTQAVITRFAAKLWEEANVLRISFFGSAVGVFLVFFVRTPRELYLVGPVFAIFNGLIQANIVALVSRSAGKDVQGRVLGINASVQALAHALPSVFSGFVAAALMPEAPILVSSAGIFLAGIVFLSFYRPAIDHFSENI